MKVREELRNSILEKLRQGADPLRGFYCSDEVKDAVLAVIVSGRHLLVEGPPGTGKTTLAKILAGHLQPMETVAGCRYNCEPGFARCPDCLTRSSDPHRLIIPGKDRFVRVQGSPELVPEDLMGDVNPVVAMQCGIRDPQAFTPGKIQRANRKILFVDELNRLPERTQNTLIQVLEEGKTTVAGLDIDIPVDTIVFATQNPQEYAGVERISETLGDRFEHVKISYPSVEHEIAILKTYGRRLDGVEFKDDLLLEVVGISQSTRNNEDFSRPASVRASIATFEQAQAMARLKGRNAVCRNDIEKAGVISLEGRTEISEASRHYENPRFLFRQIIENNKKAQ